MPQTNESIINHDIEKETATPDLFENLLNEKPSSNTINRYRPRLDWFPNQEDAVDKNF